MKYLMILILFLSVAAKAYGYKSGEITIYGNKPYKADVLIANKPKEWVLGLMFIKHLDEHTGLLMVMPVAKIAVWMKNMLMPIDCIYIDKGRIVKVYGGLPVCAGRICRQYHSGAVVDMVLEVPAGTAKEYGIKKGDRIKAEITP